MCANEVQTAYIRTEQSYSGLIRDVCSYCGCTVDGEHDSICPYCGCFFINSKATYDEREAFMAGFEAGMNHYAGLMSKRDAIDFLKREWDGDEPIYWTVGLSYRNPATHNVPLTLDEAISEINDTREWIDVFRTEYDGTLHLDFLSGNDMW